MQFLRSFSGLLFALKVAESFPLRLPQNFRWRRGVVLQREQQVRRFRWRDMVSNINEPLEHSMHVAVLAVLDPGIFSMILRTTCSHTSRRAPSSTCPSCPSTSILISSTSSSSTSSSRMVPTKSTPYAPARSLAFAAKLPAFVDAVAAKDSAPGVVPTAFCHTRTRSAKPSFRLIDAKM